ncbi:MAG: HD domain-containing phosphohydrolase [Eubacteriales bacterium]
MRKRNTVPLLPYKIMVLDDEVGIIDSLSIVLKRHGYYITGMTSPVEAIESMRNEKYDLLILDFLMQPINGDKVVAKIREFDEEIYILLLTGQKDMAPPLETIRELGIQGYCEKDCHFDQLILLVESAIKSIEQIRTIRKFQDGLNKILESVPNIYRLQPIGSILGGILTEVMNFVDSRNSFILVDSMEDNISTHNSIFRGIGKYHRSIENCMAMLDSELIERIGHARTTKQVIKMETGVILPLVSEYSQIIGIIYIESTNYKSEIKLLEIFASQAASALNNAFLHSLVNMRNEELTRTYLKLKKTYVDTIQALRLTVDARDEYTCGHSDRVAFFAKIVGQEFGLPPDQLELLSTAGVFHDIGKIGTADNILKKANKLTKEEYDVIKLHPLKGARILSATSMFHDVVPLVKYHHEWVNGSGYPEGLRGDEIPFLASIITVADAFDAMTSDRSYRKKMDIKHAREQLLEGAGIQFDAKVTAVFIRIIIDNASEVMKRIEPLYENHSAVS